MAIKIKRSKNGNKAEHKLDDRSLNNNKKAGSKVGKSGIFGKLTDYGKNVLKSTKNLAFDVVDSYVPNMKEIAEDIKMNASESLRDARKTVDPIVSFAKKKINNVEGDSLKEKLSNSAKASKSDILNRLKTGNFYSNQSDNANAGLDDDLGFGDDFGDFGFDDDFDYSDDSTSGTYTSYSEPDTLSDEPFTGITHGASLITNVSAKQKKYRSSRSKPRRKGSSKVIINNKTGELRLGDELVSNSIIEVANSMIQQNEEIWARNFAASQQHSSLVVGYEKHILTGVNAIVEFNNNIMGEVAKSTLEFHEKSLAASQDTIDLLKEIKDSIIVTSTYKPDEVTKKEYLNGKNLGKDYYKNIGNNIEYLLDDMGLGGLTDAVSMMGDMLDMSSDLGMKVDPVSMAIKFLAKSSVSKLNKGKMKLLNDRLENFGSSFLGKMNELREYGNGAGQILGKLFGMRESALHRTNNLAVKDLNAVVGWTARSDRTLNEVIPTYLRKLLAATTGQDELVYDHTKGGMVSAKGIKADIAERKRRAETNETILQYNARIAANGSNSLFKTEEFKKKMMEAVKSGEATSNEDYMLQVSKKARENIDKIVNNIVRSGVPFNAARAALSDFNNEYAERLLEGVEGSNQEKRIALIMLCENFNRMTITEQRQFNDGIMKAFTESQNNYNQMQSDMINAGFGSLYFEDSIKDEILERERALNNKRRRDINTDGTYRRGKGGISDIRRQEKYLSELKELQQYKYASGVNNEEVKAVAGGYQLSGGGGVSVPGTINNIFRLLVQGIPVYNLPLTDGLPSHLKELRKELGNIKEDEIDYSMAEKIMETYNNLNAAKFKERNRVYGKGNIFSAVMDNAIGRGSFNRGIGKLADAGLAFENMLFGQAGSHGEGIFQEESIVAQEKQRLNEQKNALKAARERRIEAAWQKELKEKNKNGKMTKEQIARAKKKFYENYEGSTSNIGSFIDRRLDIIESNIDDDLANIDNIMDNPYSRENGGFKILSNLSDQYINDYYNLENSYSDAKNQHKTKGSFYYGYGTNARKKNSKRQGTGLSASREKMYRSLCTKIVKLVNDILMNPKLKNGTSAKKLVRKAVGNNKYLKEVFEEAFRENLIQEFLDSKRGKKEKKFLIDWLKGHVLSKLNSLEFQDKIKNAESNPMSLSSLESMIGGAPKFAAGGIVPDVSNDMYSDKVITRQNPGEMNLNRAQQRNLFNFIQNLNGTGTDVLKASQDKLSSVLNGSTDNTAIKIAKKGGIFAGMFTLLSQMNKTLAGTLKVIGGNDKGELDEKNKETLAGLVNEAGGGGGDDKDKKKGLLSTLGIGGTAAIITAGIHALSLGNAAKETYGRFKHEGIGSGISHALGFDAESNSMYNADGTEKSGIQRALDRSQNALRRGIYMGGEKKMLITAKDAAMKTGVGKGVANIGKKMIKNSQRLATAFSKGGVKGGMTAIGRMTKQGAKAAMDGVIKSIKENIVNFMSSNKVLSKLKIPKSIGEKLGKGIGEKVGKELTKEATKQGAKSGFKGAVKAVPVVGWIIAGADVLYNLAEGYNLAGRYFGVNPNDVTPTMRTVSMIVKGIKSLISNLLAITGIGIVISTAIEMLVPDDWLVNFIYNIIAPEEEKQAAINAKQKQEELASSLGIDRKGLSEAQNLSTASKIASGIQTAGSKLFGQKKSYDQINREKVLKKINKQRTANGASELSYDEFASIDKTDYQSNFSKILKKIRGISGKSAFAEFEDIRENYDSMLNSGDKESVKKLVEAAKEKDKNVSPLNGNLSTLTDSFRQKWQKLLNDPEIIAAGIKPAISGARRPFATQLALYAKGRSDLDTLDEAAKAAGFKQGKDFWANKEDKVTWTLKSKHLDGNALDIDTNSLTGDQLALLGKKAGEYGIEWGGNWEQSKQDLPHFEDAKPTQYFSKGGIVAGERDKLMNDKVHARLNPKEMVLNDQQQAGLFSMIKSAGNKVASNTTANFRNPFEVDAEITNGMIEKALAIQARIYEEQRRHNSIAEKFFEAIIKLIAGGMNAPRPRMSGGVSSTDSDISDALIAGAKAIAAGL